MECVSSHVRLKIEERENKYLSPKATKSSETKGRKKFEEPCSMRTEFQEIETESFTLKLLED